MLIEIVSKVNITITQEDMEKMVREKVAAEDANIIVEEIKFIPRQRPSRVEVEVVARYGADTPAVDEPVVTEEAAPFIEPEVKEEVVTSPDSTEGQAELDLDSLMGEETTSASVIDEIEEQSKDTAPEETSGTIAGLFN